MSITISCIQFHLMQTFLNSYYSQPKRIHLNVMWEGELLTVFPVGQFLFLMKMICLLLVFYAMRLPVQQRLTTFTIKSMAFPVIFISHMVLRLPRDPELNPLLGFFQSSYDSVSLLLILSFSSKYVFCHTVWTFLCKSFLTVT
jgi:hypothetical protein